MTDSARRLASKVVAGVGLLVAGCNEIRTSGGAGERLDADGLRANQTAVEDLSRQETPRVKVTGTSTHESGSTPDSSAIEKPDPTPPNDPTPTAGASTPTRAAPTVTETSVTPSGGNESESWPPDSGTSASVSGGSTAGGSTGGGGDSVSTPSDGSGSGSGDGTNDGSSDGTNDGSSDGTNDGSSDGTNDGSSDGTNDGSSDGSSDGTNDGSSDGTNDGSSDGTNDGSSDGSTDGPALTVVGTSGTAPLAAVRTISLGASEIGYLGDVDLDRAFVAAYSFAAADGRPLNFYLLPHEDLDPLRAGEAYRTHLTFSDLPSFEMGPFTLAAGRYAIVVEQADDSATTPVDVTFEFELRSEA